ncbi:MAG: NDP-sugar synthase [Myxococcota bacterium]|nr:NDP-sugar synthase [Myxococcota bacterium]
MTAPAFLLAAGFGTRMRPLTEHRPKPLVPVCGKPIADYSLALLRKHGFHSAVVNAHHLSEEIEEWADKHTMPLRLLVEKPEILGTGGGLRNALTHLDENVVVVNGDILSNVDLSALMSSVKSLGPSAAGAMALRTQLAQESYGIVASDTGGCVVDLVGLAEANPVGAVDRSTHFTGIHALNREALELVPPGKTCIVRSAYCTMVPQRQVAALPHRGLWVDVGNPANYLEANIQALRGAYDSPLDPLVGAGWALSQGKEVGSADHVTLHKSARVMSPFWLGKNVHIESDTELGPNCIIGDHAVIRSGCKLKDCVVWDGVEVPSNTVLEHAIVHDGGVLKIPNTSR